MDNIYSMGTQNWRRWITYWINYLKDNQSTYSPPYKSYIAKISQTGTENPIATVILNELDAITLTRQGVGNYYFQCETNQFNLYKTVHIFYPDATSPQMSFNTTRQSASRISLTSDLITIENNLFVYTGADELIESGIFEIRVYN